MRLAVSTNVVFAADIATSSVLEFTRTGKLARRIGGKGKGPGEFIAAATMTTVGDSLLVVLDAALKRVSLYSTLRHEHARIIAVPGLGFSGYRVGFLGSNLVYHVDEQGAVLDSVAPPAQHRCSVPNDLAERLSKSTSPENEAQSTSSLVAIGKLFSCRHIVRRAKLDQCDESSYDDTVGVCSTKMPMTGTKPYSFASRSAMRTSGRRQNFW